VARHIFRACPVWIYTQSNITQATYSPAWVHYTNTANFMIHMPNGNDINLSAIKRTYRCVRQSLIIFAIKFIIAHIPCKDVKKSWSLINTLFGRKGKSTNAVKQLNILLMIL
jgi:hypothetical protein